MALKAHVIFNFHSLMSQLGVLSSFNDHEDSAWPSSKLRVNPHKQAT